MKGLYGRVLRYCGGHKQGNILSGPFTRHIFLPALNFQPNALALPPKSHYPLPYLVKNQQSAIANFEVPGQDFCLIRFHIFKHNTFENASSCNVTGRDV